MLTLHLCALKREKQEGCGGQREEGGDEGQKRKRRCGGRERAAGRAPTFPIVPPSDSLEETADKQEVSLNSE